MAFMMRDKWKGKDYKIWDLNVILSQNEDLAVSAYKIEFNGTVDDKEITVSATETTVFSKKSNEWEIIHSHTSNKIVNSI